MKKNGLAGNSGRGRKPAASSPKSAGSAKGGRVVKSAKKSGATVAEEIGDNEQLSLGEEEKGAGDNVETPSKKANAEAKEEAGLV